MIGCADHNFPIRVFGLGAYFFSVLMKEQINRNEKLVGDYICISSRISLVNHQGWAWTFANETLRCTLTLFGRRVSQIWTRWLFLNCVLRNFSLAYPCNSV